MLSRVVPPLNYYDIVHVVLLFFQILLDNCEALKLSDFTLAQSVEDSDKQVRYDFRSTAKVVFGERSSKDVGELQIGGRRGEVVLSVVDSVPSPFYAAPELFDGAKFSTASDLWSLGVLMYELCTGGQACIIL